MEELQNFVGVFKFENLLRTTRSTVLKYYEEVPVKAEYRGFEVVVR